jgi:hypothetical protein
MKSCSSGEVRGGEIARNCGNWKLGEELTGEGWTVAVLGQSPREGGGARVAGGGGPGAGSGGDSWALERRSRRGVEMGERVGQRAGSERLGGGAVEGKKGGKSRGSGRGVPRGAGAPWGLAPTGGRCPDRVPANCDPGAARAGGASLFWTGAHRGR